MVINFVTGNVGKLAEAKAILGEGVVQALEIDLPEIQETDPRKIIKHKLAEALKYSKQWVMAEDVSLCLECLGGLPGPLIKWFLKSIGGEGISRLCQRMGNNRAAAKVIIGLAESNSDIHFFEGKVEGVIVAPRGEGGFGWDAIFVPDGAQKTFAQMTAEEKNKVSMRRTALELMRRYLKLAEGSDATQG